jgi:hypothetical protein
MHGRYKQLTFSDYSTSHMVTSDAYTWIQCTVIGYEYLYMQCIAMVHINP